MDVLRFFSLSIAFRIRLFLICSPHEIIYTYPIKICKGIQRFQRDFSCSQFISGICHMRGVHVICIVFLILIDIFP